jgi:hypothetical protein
MSTKRSSTGLLPFNCHCNSTATALHCYSLQLLLTAFAPLPFSHPIWVLYSSGTTGMPKAITHSHGGNLLEHLKYLHFHNDMRPGERFFWYSTTGWMMWNFTLAALLAGATIVLYDGSPGYPDLERAVGIGRKSPITHFGTSAPFLVSCMKAGFRRAKVRPLTCAASAPPARRCRRKPSAGCTNTSKTTCGCRVWRAARMCARPGWAATRCCRCIRAKYNAAASAAPWKVGTKRPPRAARRGR